MPVLAHGGTVGALAEGAFILVPIVVFGVLARISRKRRDAEAAAEAGDADAGDATP